MEMQVLMLDGRCRGDVSCNGDGSKRWQLALKAVAGYLAAIVYVSHQRLHSAVFLFNRLIDFYCWPGVISCSHTNLL